MDGLTIVLLIASIREKTFTCQTHPAEDGERFHILLARWASCPLCKMFLANCKNFLTFNIIVTVVRINHVADGMTNGRADSQKFLRRHSYSLQYVFHMFLQLHHTITIIFLV